MATLLQPIDFTDKDAKDVVSNLSDDYVNDAGDNVYLAKGDEYLAHLQSEFDVDTDSADLADPIKFKVKETLLCYIKTLIFQDLIDDARAPFETQEIMIDKYRDKLAEAQKCHEKWYSTLNENSFYTVDVGVETSFISTFARR